MTSTAVQLRWASLSDLNDRFGDLEARLPADERERARRFKIEAARHRFVLARSLLRHTMSTALEVAPGTLAFGVGDRGKPHLFAPETTGPIEFNLSHSGDIVVLAIAPLEIGVDVESLRTMANTEKLARRFFSPAERQSVIEVEGSARDRAFLRIWTQKEAYLKAIGLGVGMPLREVETEPDPTRSPRLISIAGDTDEACRWTLIDVGIPDAVCTVAVREPAAELEVRRLTPADLFPR